MTDYIYLCQACWIRINNPHTRIIDVGEDIRISSDLQYAKQFWALKALAND